MIERVILIFFIVCVNSLMADLEDHLKKLTDKFCVHSLKGIDFIYVINLDQRPEKFALCSLQLNAFGIQPYRFSAVNGWELSLEAINDVGIKYEPWMTMIIGVPTIPVKENFVMKLYRQIGRNYFSHCMSRGAIGIVLSHLSVLQDHIFAI